MNFCYGNAKSIKPNLWILTLSVIIDMIDTHLTKYHQRKRLFYFRTAKYSNCMRYIKVKADQIIYCCIECSLTLLFFIMVYLTIYACRMFVYKQSGVSVVVFNATFNNFSYIVPVCFIDGGDQSTQRNHRPAASYWQTLSHNVESSTPRLNII
jgi:hypothetical protein